MDRSRLLFVLAVTGLVSAACDAAGESSRLDTGPSTTVVVSTTDAVTSTASSATTGPPVASVVERADWAGRFAELGVDGTFVLRQVGSSETEVHDAGRAAAARLPASTFKIVSSLVALETGVVADVDDVAAWDGVDRSRTEWNRDQSLRSAFEVSAVWRYQEIVREIGSEPMAEWLGRLGYGNADIAGGIDRFWLDGALRISSLGQLDLVEALMTDELAFRPEVQAAVRDIFVREQGAGWAWSHKSGTTSGQTPDISWLVGATEWNGDRSVFALRIDRDGAGSPDRRAIEAFVRSLLVDEGALPPA